eukprot:CAMPEP_0181121592 /NCGR_PEP_ID=MMETSP1071-20121207/24826_1 /TAXON_ID=35127 /ORGANISM="Thalassiosira sp., Strain NH16" /LENGTH=258 /DNA_ID=CAMNT_0023206433 /DNA_START=772 /DNA_END=1548 /DNA_ORIENTATION=+
MPPASGHVWDFSTPTNWSDWSQGRVHVFSSDGVIFCNVSNRQFTAVYTPTWSASWNDTEVGNPDLANYQASWFGGGKRAKNRGVTTKARVENMVSVMKRHNVTNIRNAFVVGHSCYWDLCVPAFNGAIANITEYANTHKQRVLQTGIEIRRLFGQKAFLVWQSCLPASAHHKNDGIRPVNAAALHNALCNESMTISAQLGQWNKVLSGQSLLGYPEQFRQSDNTHYPIQIHLTLINRLLNLYKSHITDDSWKINKRTL